VRGGGEKENGRKRRMRRREGEEHTMYTV